MRRGLTGYSQFALAVLAYGNAAASPRKLDDGWLGWGPKRPTGVLAFETRWRSDRRLRVRENSRITFFVIRPVVTSGSRWSTMVGVSEYFRVSRFVPQR